MCRQMKNSFIMLLTDIVLAAAIILGIWYFGYCVPQNGVPAADSVTVINTEMSENLSELAKTNVTGTADDWREKFADKFSDTVISTENSYKSPDFSI